MKFLEQLITITFLLIFWAFTTKPAIILPLVFLFAFLIGSVLLRFCPTSASEKSASYIYFLIFYPALLFFTGKDFLAGIRLPNITTGIYTSVFVGNFINFLINKIMWMDLPKEVREHKDKYSFVNLLGILELLLYILAIKSAQYSLIIFWIGTKIAVTWKSFSKESQGGMSSHHIFLIGNVLNILWAFLGAILCFGVSALMPK